eukprot:227342_1
MSSKDVRSLTPMLRLEYKAREYLQNYETFQKSSLTHTTQTTRSRPKCPTCWMKTPLFCVCSRTRNGIKFSSIIYMFMHFKEIGHAKASNTGKLLLMNGSERFVLGIPDDENRLSNIIRADHAPHACAVCERLISEHHSLDDTAPCESSQSRSHKHRSSLDLLNKRCYKLRRTSDSGVTPKDSGLKPNSVESPKRQFSKDPEFEHKSVGPKGVQLASYGSPEWCLGGSTIVLYPSSDSVTVDQLIQRRTEKGLGSKPAQWHIIVLDGTWRDSKLLNKRIPLCVPRVRLTAADRSARLQLRKSSNKHQVSTAAALIELLRELGENENSIASLEYNLDLVTDAYQRQSQKPLHS